MKKISVILIIATLVLTVAGCAQSPISREEMTPIFEWNYELLVVVRDYFRNSEHTNITVRNTDERGKMFIGSSWGEAETGEQILIRNYIEIEDDAVVEALSVLKERGFIMVQRNRHTVHFQRWATLDVSRGIVCSIDGAQPNIEFLTRLEALSVPGWYYYEVNFDAWRQGARP